MRGIWALDLGAADHLAAPFATREALARVERLIAQQRVDATGAHWSRET